MDKKDKQTKEKKEKNIFQKLLEVRKSVPYIKKGAKGFGYNYTSESQILGAIRTELDNQGLWLEMEMTELKPSEISVYVKDAKKYVTVNGIRAYFEFKWVNCDKPEETIIKHLIVQDAGSDVKTIGGLQTYANKYFLLKFFNIPNDNLDPDKFEKVIETSTTKLDSPNFITTSEAREIMNVTSTLTVAQYQRLLKILNISDMQQVPAGKYENTMKYIKNYINKQKGIEANEIKQSEDK